jgi:hypothetical protein
MDDRPEWTPATSEPGEMYTPEGRVKSAGAFASGWKNRDPRGKSYRRSMMRSALMAMAMIVVAAVIIAGFIAIVG